MRCTSVHNLTALVEELEQTSDVINTLSVRDLRIEQLPENAFGDVNVRHIDLSHNAMLRQVWCFVSRSKSSGERFPVDLAARIRRSKCNVARVDRDAHYTLRDTTIRCAPRLKHSGL